MKILRHVEDKINNLVDDLDYKHVVNSAEEGIGNESYVHYLDVPFIGGLLYVYHSFKQANVFRRNYDKKLHVRKQVINMIKDEEMISRSIRHQLDTFLNTKDVAIIKVPQKHLSKFKKVVNEYSDTITWSSRPDGKIVLVKKNET